MTSGHLRRYLALIGCALVPSALVAQDSVVVDRARLCFRGRPAPACNHFAITEIGLYHPIVRSQEAYIAFDGTRFVYPAVERQGTIQVGGMVNRGSRTALGGTLLFGVGTGGADFGVLGRYRRWLTPEGVALDISTGFVQGRILAPENSGTTYAEATAPGITVEVALNAADYGAVVMRTDVLRARGVDHAALYGGVRLGSRPAIAGGVVTLLGFGILLAALANAEW